MDLYPVRAVLEFVIDPDHVTREFPRLSDGNEADAERIGHGRPEDEATGLDAGDQVDRLVLVTSHDGVDGFPQSGSVL